MGSTSHLNSGRNMTGQTNSNSRISNPPDLAADRRQQLAALIPEAFSEGQLDVAALKRALEGEAMIEGGERYALTWAGKANAYKVRLTAHHITCLLCVNTSSHLTMQRDHFRPGLQLSQIVRPLLHHLPAVRQELCPVVSCTQCIRNTVR